jgi:hypothetical protein
MRIFFPKNTVLHYNKMFQPLSQDSTSTIGRHPRTVVYETYNRTMN